LSTYFIIHILYFSYNLYLCQVAAAKGESEDKHALIFALFALIALIGEGQREDTENKFGYQELKFLLAVLG